MMPAASSSFTRFQHGVLDKPTASASCCTVWRESRCSSASSSTSWRSSGSILVFTSSKECHSPPTHSGEERESTFSLQVPKLCSQETPQNMAETTAPDAAPIVRPDYQLSDSLWAGG